MKARLRKDFTQNVSIREWSHKLEHSFDGPIKIVEELTQEHCCLGDKMKDLALKVRDYFTRDGLHSSEVSKLISRLSQLHADAAFVELPELIDDMLTTLNKRGMSHENYTIVESSCDKALTNFKTILAPAAFMVLSCERRDEKLNEELEMFASGRTILPLMARLNCPFSTYGEIKAEIVNKSDTDYIVSLAESREISDDQLVERFVSNVVSACDDTISQIKDIVSNEVNSKVEFEDEEGLTFNSRIRGCVTKYIASKAKNIVTLFRDVQDVMTGESFSKAQSFIIAEIG